MSTVSLRSFERMEDQWVKDTSLFFLQVVFAETVRDSAIILSVGKWYNAVFCKDTWVSVFVLQWFAFETGLKHSFI